MSVKLLRDVAKESRNEKECDLLPFPEQFARCVAETTKQPNGSPEVKADKPTAFVTSSGLRFIFVKV
jgi:hypothetical protein